MENHRWPFFFAKGSRIFFFRDDNICFMYRAMTSRWCIGLTRVWLEVVVSLQLATIGRVFWTLQNLSHWQQKAKWNKIGNQHLSRLLKINNTVYKDVINALLLFLSSHFFLICLLRVSVLNKELLYCIAIITRTTKS